MSNVVSKFNKLFYGLNNSLINFTTKKNFFTLNLYLLTITLTHDIQLRISI